MRREIECASHPAQLPTQLYDFLQAQDSQHQQLGIPEQILNLLSMQHNAIFANADMYDSGAWNGLSRGVL